MLAITCALAAPASCNEAAVAQVSPSPVPAASAPPVRSDACGGSQELLKKYLSASPCVFVRGQGSVQSTYSGTNVPVVFMHEMSGKTVTSNASRQAFGYPGLLLNVGITPTSQVTMVLPSFSQVSSTQTGTAAGTADTEYRYKQLVYSDPRRGILGGILLTYQAPTGSPALTAGSPSYEVNPLLNVALNKARTIGENLSFPLTNAPANGGAAARQWSFAPQGVTFWRSPGGTLAAVVVQYGFSNNALYLTLNAAQLLSRNFQIQGTYGGNDMPVDYVNPVEDIGRAGGKAYSRSFTIGISYLIGQSEAPSR
jgi:FlaG/FlaF family flagellin (archaellin)